MCGIIGLALSSSSTLSDESVESITFELLRLSEARGKESSGVAIKNFIEGNLGVYKAPVPATKLLQRKDFRKFYGEYSRRKAESEQLPLAIIAHARLVTNGKQDNNNNNQPIIKNGMVAVHNGIIVNVDELWNTRQDWSRKFELDTEIVLELLDKNLANDPNLIAALKDVLQQTYGCISMAVLSQNNNKLFIFTNHGSLYTLSSRSGNEVLCASEKFILLKLAENLNLQSIIGEYDIEHVQPDNLVSIDLSSFEVKKVDLRADHTSSSIDLKKDHDGKLENFTPDAEINLSAAGITGKASNLEKLLEYKIEDLKSLKRCSKCVLPYTFPFIEFDQDGVCNYCHSYSPINIKGDEELEKLFSQHKRNNNEADCLIPLSGGRDSCYSLHYLVEKLGKRPLAYTYDWGMVTDLARRNSSRLCSKLKIEHIIVSADINRKRQNIKSNVVAWLSKPHLGTIPLFMAGDKQYFKYAYELSRRNDISLILMGENYYEKTSFKSGFAGLRQTGAGLAYSIGIQSKLQMLWFYFTQFATNPLYINRSLVDSMNAFVSYFFTPHNYENLFDYIEWDEDVVEDVLFNNYDWEISPDTTTTWRIGDGTAAFYNYIYLSVAGFSEIDTFRSNQIRENKMSREQALEHVFEENKPRYNSLKWYLDIINVDYESAIKRINSIEKLYTA